MTKTGYPEGIRDRILETHRYKAAIAQMAERILAYCWGLPPAWIPTAEACMTNLSAASIKEVQAPFELHRAFCSCLL